ncbi:MAG: ABC transporter ATP-binding protein [Gemmatimonadaceae bacterium]|jgi:ABC-2 type transport system ATP-binding protein|nr:ABC transporter ATP-binding protein [Gemmatimonadaceae bacterium]
MTHAITFEAVERAYPSAEGRGKRTLALRGISLSVGEGEFVGLLGPNGAGKTTLLRCGAGLMRPDRGTIAWFGRPEPRRLPRGVALVTDAPAYYRFLTVREALEHYATLHDIPAAARGRHVEQLLDAVALTPHAGKRIAELSRGMTQRIGIAQALAGRPRLLLLDETLGGLDPVTRRKVREVLRQAAHEGCAIILSTHDVATLERLADRVLVQHDGQLAGEIDPRQFTWARWLVLDVPDAESAAGRLSGLGPLRRVRETVGVPLDGRTPEAVLAAVRAAGVTPQRTRVEVDDLEARYLDIVARVSGDPIPVFSSEVA